jgi:hypothetical protein
MVLDHGAHGAIENKDALAEQAVKQLSARGHAIVNNKKPVRLSGTGLSRFSGIY